MDVLVIGAGIVGAACAFELAARGARVTVLERESSPATGSTARSAAGLRHQFSLPVNVAMSRYGADVFADFQARIGADAEFRRVGYLFLIPEAAVEAWRAQNRMQRAHGSRSVLLESEEAARRFPWLSWDGVAAASFGPDDGVLDPHGATLGYLAAARACGARLVTDAPVTGLEPRAGRWRAVTGAGAFEADAVVNAAGPYAAEIGALAGLELPVVPSRRNVYVTAPLPGFAHHPTPLTVDVATGVYLRSEGQRFLFGLSNPAQEPGYDLSVDWAWLEETLERALPRFPELERAGLDRRACWAGLYAITPDHLPILGRAPGLEGFVNAVGFSGHGVQHAPATGRIVAEELLDGTVASFDVAPFRLERFAAAPRPLEANIV